MFSLQELLNDLSLQWRNTNKLCGDNVAKNLKFDSILELLSSSSKYALIGTDDVESPTTHSRLVNFIKNEGDLNRFGLGRGDRIGVLLPLGPHLIVSILTAITYCTCAPINPMSTEEEIKSELKNLRIKAVIVLDDPSSSHIQSASQSLNIQIIFLRPNSEECGLFSLTSTNQSQHIPNKLPINHSKSDDIAIVLHTSGTTGTKKIVPIKLRDLCVSAVLVASSMQLNNQDICLNMMPLFHVGGIVRNLLAPLLAGGSIICTTGVDPSLFWKLCKTKNCTWYYAAPTIHMSIIEEAEKLENTLCSIRIIVNAAGNLPPTVAGKLKNLFHATILPSYGMTECMPISCPPPQYNLERIGSSGIVVGPQLCIMDDTNNIVPAGITGNIMIRGIPVMSGYENDVEANTRSFTEDGWFSTGDRGYLDNDNYIYITGRSKEVINRGGEIISPLEIESIISTHPSIKEVVAFAISHSKLQESVGVAMVIRNGSMRPGLRSLHKFLDGKLHPSKWPQVIVFMNELAKTSTGKPQRIGLSSRMNLAEISDQTPENQRIFESLEKILNSSISSPISTNLVSFSIDFIDEMVAKIPNIRMCISVNNCNQIVTYVESEKDDIKSLQTKIFECIYENLVPEYLHPDSVFIMKNIPRNIDGSLDLENIQVTAQGITEKKITNLMAKIIGISENKILPNSDFFEIGGDSIKSGQLVSLIRENLKISLPTTSIFSLRTVNNISSRIKQLKENEKLKEPENVTKNTKKSMDFHSMKPESQTSIKALLIQLLPLAFFLPLRRSLSWVLFLNLFVWTNQIFPNSTEDHRLMALLTSIFGCVVIRSIVFPLFFIFAKWLIIGKFKAGKFPLWGSYYLRWWIVDQLQRLTGQGMFQYFDWSISLYYQLLGVKIGKNVRIDGTTVLGEFDLLIIGDNCVIEKKCSLRPFVADSGAMLLQKITIGSNCFISDRVVISPGSNIPSHSYFKPTTSSYENFSNNENLDIPMINTKPHWLMICFIGIPLLLIIYIISFLPVYFILKFMSEAPWHKNINNWTDAVHWYLVKWRILIYLALRSIYSLITPLIRLILGIIVKRVVVGKFRSGKIPNTQWTKFRYWIVPYLIGDGRFFKLSSLFGSHYEIISSIYRLLGAKIGKRVYWPGSGFPIIEFDLLEIEDDVVFGSRTNVKFSSNGFAAPVKFDQGCNIADRCYIMPGVHVGKGTVLGSGTFAPEFSEFGDKSIWIGSNNGVPECLQKGVAENSVENSIPSPFGEAFYLRNAPYFVLPIYFIVPINFIWLVFVSTFHALPIIISLFLTNLLNLTNRPLFLISFVGIFMGIQIIFSLIAFLIDISAKWILLGKRVPGVYNWNESSYCQRWQLYLLIQNITMLKNNGLLKVLQGSAYLVYYFRFLGGKIGKNVCLYPTGADPMMTEPDLVTIGDDVCINNASVIGHLNSRGNFKLNNIVIEKRCTLRNSSRLLSGGKLMEGSKLLEHTLIMEGETISPYTVWQGWPANLVEQPYSDWKQSIVK